MVKKFKVIGLMSGSSLDGLDIAYCSFQVDTTNPNPIKKWELLQSETVPFTEMWVSRLANLPNQTAYDFVKTNTYFSHYCGEIVNTFIKKYKIDVDFIAAHGHTIFHYPDKRLTVQIGDGAALAAITGLPVINDFRTHDIAINGEGTPIAPIADAYLFAGYDFYLNLGGIANISQITEKGIIAFDICPANQILNALSRELGMEYDKNGQIARGGQRLESLFQTVNKHPYYQKPFPKSLDNNQVFHMFTTTFLDAEGSWQDKLHTATMHIALQIANTIKQLGTKKSPTLFISGGGAFNQYLIENIQKFIPEIQIIMPDSKIIMFKEAILMGLMGVLRVVNIPNCLASVTGADQDTIGGAIYQGTKKIL